MSEHFQRARAPEHKALRREAILRAASARLDAQSFPDITIASIAREAGLAKGSIYRYFSTREEIFLALFCDAYDAWSVELHNRLDAYISAQDVREVVRVVVLTLREHTTMLRLRARLALDILQNLTPEASHGFKTWTLEADLSTGARLERTLGLIAHPERPTGFVGAQYLMRLHALCAGLWPVAAAPHDEAWRVDFWEELTFSLGALWSGAAPARSDSPWSI